MPLTEEERKERHCIESREYYRKHKKERKEYNAKYRKENHETLLVKGKKRRDSNKPQKAATDKAYRKNNSVVIKKKKAAYYQSVKDNTGFKENQLRISQQCRERLTDGYVKGVIVCHVEALGVEDIPQSLIKAKRAYIKGMRLIKEQEHEGQKD